MGGDVTGGDQSDERPRRLLAALAIQGARPASADLVGALTTAVDEIVLPGLGADELMWHTAIVTRTDDLERRPPPILIGREWARAGAVPDDLFESVAVAGLVPGRSTLPPDPKESPVHAVARVPTGGRGPVTIAVSVHEWALAGGRVGPDVARAVSRWLLGTAERLDAETGYVTLDFVDAHDGTSAWEQVVQASPSQRDVSRTVWGYGWGTLLSASHVSAVGGASALSAVPGANVLVGPGGRMWVRLGDDPAAVTRPQVAALRMTLTPVLPTGLRTLAEFERAVLAPFEVPLPPFLI
jgi:hypothetical protein